MKHSALMVLPILLALGSCTARQIDSNWAIDQQIVYCANTRASGFTVGNPQSFAGVPIIGQALNSTAQSLRDEEACKVVRTLSPGDVEELKIAQAIAARENRALPSGPFIITPRPIGADCLPIETLHRPSGQMLRQETLCRTKQGSYAPLGQR